MSDSPVYILGIESSCDETSASVLRDKTELSNIIANQDLIHRFFGGVVPELASRAHQQKIVLVVDEALRVANITKNELHAVSVTIGPGLMGALHVGVSFAKAMAFGLDIPLIGINHMQGHVLAHFIKSEKMGLDKEPSFPFLCMTVSGGHTQIIRVDSYLDMTIIGETQDDAAGEAFDKAAKIVGLPYPGGPLIDRYAKKGNPNRFSFPKPQVPGLDFSFSGLKTAFLYFIQKEVAKDADFISSNMDDICASIQHSIVHILLDKLKLAASQTGISDIAIAGGVSANSYLRTSLNELGEREAWRVFIPPFAYCTDNAAMIAMAGYFHYMAGHKSALDISPKARMPF
ncbi:MAG: tRNA (adenosine(37)-N6)-threonylcarbamoyltransferase complex transferase subunit TsaD [Bacteroidetes bacterium]|nr:MAG: tRNA (adenosine(37)-N6)-threonylcarbamoyltransferase complex transferase subunit TsaD [Bacteroidota bacterium]